MRNSIASVLQFVGIVGFIAGGFLVSIPAGIICTSVVCGILGVLVDHPVKK